MREESAKLNWVGGGEGRCHFHLNELIPVEELDAQRNRKEGIEVGFWEQKSAVLGYDGTNRTKTVDTVGH